MKKKKKVLQDKLKEIGDISLMLISKFKREPNNADIYDKLVKINALAHEIYDSLRSED